MMVDCNRVQARMLPVPGYDPDRHARSRRPRNMLPVRPH
jgi:hypothetical protein